ncbi:MAG: hypothetical protein AAF439_14460 [Pseudomonadota bacterium]
MTPVLGGLAWLGVRARWFLALGLVAALLVPGPGTLLEGTLPFWVALLTGLAMVRIDLSAIIGQALRPGRLLRNAALLTLLMAVTPAVLATLVRIAGLPENMVSVLVYTASAPPLGSATAFCLILGLNAAFALELTVLGSLIAPFTMPLVSRWLLGEAVPIEALEMLTRLAVIIGSAAIGAVIVRRLVGSAWIERQKLAFDGLSAICMVLFLFPLFLGLTDQILQAGMFAASIFALACAANLGTQILSFWPNRAIAGRETGGAMSLVWGNRNAALALASVPGDPVLLLYVALYQFPMYCTPLVMRWVVGPPRH